MCKQRIFEIEYWIKERMPWHSIVDEEYRMLKDRYINKVFSREIDEWSAITIGEQTLKERLYTFFVIF